MIQDQNGAAPHQPANPDARVTTLVYGYLGRAYMLSKRDRRLLNIADVVVGLALFAAVICARFDLLGIAALLEIMVGLVALRFAVIKIYLVAMRVPPNDMTLPERARLAHFALRGRVEGALRTLSVISGLCLIGVTALLAVNGDLLSKLGLLLSVGLLILFVAAVIADVLVHRYYARHSQDGDRR